MRSFKRYVQCLQESQYIENIILNNGDNRAFSKLLSNGKIFQTLLQKKLTYSEEESKHFTVRSSCANINHRSLDFLHQEEFKQNFWDISSSHLLNKAALRIGCPVIPAEDDTSCSFNLVFDHFVPESRELETFYNIQRGRKIWWMRYSADPSRYFVEPFDVSYSSPGNIHDETFNTTRLSSAIKSAFPFKTIDMEDIMLVPLYKLRNFQNDQKLRVSLIRTVINLGSAVSAMLLDAIDHDKEDILLLNKQLTPFQCLLLRNTVKTSDEINDLCLHINHVLCRAGLRVLYQPQHSNTLGNLSKEFKNADTMGIPYTLLVERDSLETGLLHLRNRDTSLCETVHISDLPTYLVSMFIN